MHLIPNDEHDEIVYSNPSESEVSTTRKERWN
jgi:hypothetical protein